MLDPTAMFFMNSFPLPNYNNPLVDCSDGNCVIDAVCILSPVVLMTFSSNTRPGVACSHAAFIKLDCARASALPRVAIMRGRLMSDSRWSGIVPEVRTSASACCAAETVQQGARALLDDRFALRDFHPPLRHVIVRQLL